MSKKLTVVILSISILLLSAIPSFAASSNLVPYVPFPSNTNGGTNNTELQAAYESSLIAFESASGYDGIGICTSTENSQIYACAIDSSTITGHTSSPGILVYSRSSSSRVFFPCSVENGVSPNLSHYWSLVYIYGQDKNPYVNLSISDILGESYEGAYYYYEMPADTFALSDCKLEVYPSLAAGLAALINGSTAAVKTWTLTPGYVYYIPNNGQALNLYTTFPDLSPLFSDTWKNISQQYISVSDLPSAGTTFPLPGGAVLPWTVSPPYSGALQSYNGIAPLSLQSSGYTVIYNPAYRADGTTPNRNVIMTGSVSNITAYSVTQVFSPSSPSGTGYIESSTPIYGSISDGSDAVSWSSDEQGEAPVTLNPGGGNMYTTEQEASSSGSIIDRFVKLFTDLFAKPITAIQTLIDSSSTFFQYVAGLWSWLPSDIVAVFSSVLILSAILAIIRLLWK